LTLTVAGSVTSAQLEIGDIATDYIPTTAAAVTVGPIANLPRLDYTGGGCPKLLMEPARTNLAFYSEQFDNTYYTKANGVISSNFTTSPDGYTSADKYIVNSGAASNSPIIRMISFAATTTYTFSLFVKKADYDTASIRISTSETGVIANTFDLSSGTATANQIESYGNGWYRVWVSLTTAATVTSGQIQLIRDAQIRDGVAGIFIWGAQVEAGAYATSYIPTVNASVTRNEDSAVKTGISSLIGQTEGTLFFEVDAIRTGINQNIELSDGTTSNRINLRLTSLNNFQLVILQLGINIFSQTSVATFSQGQKIKIAAAYKSNDVTQIYVNGVSVASATAGTIIGNFNSFYNSISGVLDPFNSPITQLLLFKTRLSNADLATLTNL
jgi:hypothetical protein